MKSGVSRFDWLQDYLNIEEDIRYLKWKIMKLKAEEERWACGDLANVHLESGSNGSHVLDRLNEYQAQLKTLLDEQKQLIEIVDSFHGYENDILRKKYIEGKTLEEVADELGYSYETVRAKHAEIHRRLDYLDEWEKKKFRFENRYDSDIKGI